MYQKVELTSDAWFGDRPVTLDFPREWRVDILGNHVLSALSMEEINARIGNPTGTPGLHELAAGKRRVIIVVDDLTRPTPCGDIVPIVLRELERGGVKRNCISILIAGGTHAPASKEDIERKLGMGADTGVDVLTHDARDNVVYLGKSSRGTPLYLNRSVVDADLVIGIGCIYPHPAAGFSGGPKIIAPGACGSETVRYLHDYIKGGTRGRYLPNLELMQEMQEIAERVELRFIVNVVLNQKRKMAALFAGEVRLAHQEAVDFAKRTFSVQTCGDADVVIVDAYPFDTSFQFAKDRGLWAFEGLPKSVSKVVVGGFAMGLGKHDLYPIDRPVSARLFRRVRNLQFREFRAFADKFRAIRKVIQTRSQEILVFSKGLGERELRSVYPKGRLFTKWNEVIDELVLRHKNLPVKAVVYRCSPYLIPQRFSTRY